MENLTALISDFLANGGTVQTIASGKTALRQNPCLDITSYNVHTFAYDTVEDEKIARIESFDKVALL